MCWLDIVILILCAAGLVKGLHDGLVKQLVAIVALIVGIYLCSGVATWLYGHIVQWDWFPQKGGLLISYLLGFILIVGIIVTAGNIVHRLIDATPLSIINHLFGGIVGLVFIIIIISFLLNLVEVFDIDSIILSQEIKEASRFYSIIKNIIPEIFPGNIFDIKNEFFVSWMHRTL